MSFNRDACPAHPLTEKEAGPTALRPASASASAFAGTCELEMQRPFVMQGLGAPVPHIDPAFSSAGCHLLRGLSETSLLFLLLRIFSWECV